MKKKWIVFVSLVLLFFITGCGDKKEFNEEWITFKDASIKPNYVEKKKSDKELWFSFDYRNDFSETEKAGFISKMINISAKQGDKEMALSDKTNDDFSDNLSSVYQKVGKGEDNMIIYIFNTDDFKTPVTFTFEEQEGDSKEVTIDLK